MELVADAGDSGVVVRQAILRRINPNGVCAITTPAITKRDLVISSHLK